MLTAGSLVIGQSDTMYCDPHNPLAGVGMEEVKSRGYPLAYQYSSDDSSCDEVTVYRGKVYPFILDVIFWSVIAFVIIYLTSRGKNKK